MKTWMFSNSRSANTTPGNLAVAVTQGNTLQEAQAAALALGIDPTIQSYAPAGLKLPPECVGRLMVGTEALAFTLILLTRVAALPPDELLDPDGPPAAFWLSFTDPDSGAFRGVCIVEAKDSASAIATAEHLGISPGGTVRMVFYSEAMGISFVAAIAALRPHMNRLLSKAEAQAADGEAMTAIDTMRKNRGTVV